MATMASSTGWICDGERLMTLSTSLVAVWYSSDSCSSAVRACTSSNSRDVLDRDHGLVGEGLDELDLLIREGLNKASASGR